MPMVSPLHKPSCMTGSDGDVMVQRGPLGRHRPIWWPMPRRDRFGSAAGTVKKNVEPRLWLRLDPNAASGTLDYFLADREADVGPGNLSPVKALKRLKDMCRYLAGRPEPLGDFTARSDNWDCSRVRPAERSVSTEHTMLQVKHTFRSYRLPDRLEDLQLVVGLDVFLQPVVIGAACVPNESAAAELAATKARKRPALAWSASFAILRR